MASVFKRVKEFTQSRQGEQLKEQVKEQAGKPASRRIVASSRSSGSATSSVGSAVAGVGSTGGGVVGGPVRFRRGKGREGIATHAIVDRPSTEPMAALVIAADATLALRRRPWLRQTDVHT